MGLFQFAKVMQVVYQFKSKDDPYAQWHTDKITESLLEIKKGIQTAIAEYEQKIQQWRGLEIHVFGSRKPMKLTLKFSCPAAYIAADVIGELDYLLRQAYTFRRLGILPEAQEAANRLFWEFKLTLARSRQWRHTGVTRQDVREKNQKAQRAMTLMGEIPRRILNLFPSKKTKS